RSSRWRRAARRPVTTAVTTGERSRRDGVCCRRVASSERPSRGGGVVCLLEEVGVGRQGHGRVGGPELAADEDDVHALCDQQRGQKPKKGPAGATGPEPQANYRPSGPTGKTRETGPANGLIVGSAGNAALAAVSETKCDFIGVGAATTSPATCTKAPGPDAG